MTLKLDIIIASTRPGRVGPKVADWFHNVAADHGQFDVKLVDLAEVALPIFDEPNHPRLQKYEHDHTKRWSEIVAEADAYVFVMPEYNTAPNSALVNALDYLLVEWAYKPAGFVSYGGVSGGLRAVQMTKQILTTLKVVPLLEQVVVPMVAQQIEVGVFSPTEIHQASATTLLKELHRWAEALKPMRAPAGG